MNGVRGDLSDENAGPQAQEPGADDGLEDGSHDPAAADAQPARPEENQPKPRRPVWSYKPAAFLEHPTGVQDLFRTFTMQPETIGNLRGKGHEAGDLNRVINTFKRWHLVHCPKLEYYYLLEKVQRMGKDREVAAYV